MFMNKKAYDRLPAKAKAAIDRYSGEAYSRRLGKAAMKMNAVGRARVKKMAGHTVARASKAEFARWRKRLAPLTDQWLKRTPDGAAVLEAFRAEVAKVRAGN